MSWIWGAAFTRSRDVHLQFGAVRPVPLKWPIPTPTNSAQRSSPAHTRSLSIRKIATSIKVLSADRGITRAAASVGEHSQREPQTCGSGVATSWQLGVWPGERQCVQAARYGDRGHCASSEVKRLASARRPLRLAALGTSPAMRGQKPSTRPPSLPSAGLPPLRGGKKPQGVVPKRSLPSSAFAAEGVVLVSRRRR